MEPPHKRQRISRISVPDADFQKRRARNDNRLKSIFESIFDKYGKDFDGIGDEIDLRTGEIVVNNGHLLGMASERDAGQVDSLCEEPESEFSSEEEEEEGQSPGRRDAALGPESGTSLQSIYTVDYLTQDAGNGPLLTTSGRSLHGQIVDYESEEDELADSAIKWVTPREARAIAYQKWQLPGNGPTFIDESNIEEAWRAPPLPESAPPYPSVQKALPTVGRVRRPIDVGKPGTSLWASAGRKRRRSRHAEPPRLHQQASPLPSPTGPEAGHFDTGRSGGDRKNLPWTEEEEDLLRHLKTNSTLTYRQMDSYFPKRHWESVASKWTQMVNRGKASRRNNKDIQQEPMPTSPSALCPALPTLEADIENEEQLGYQRQPRSETDFPWNHPTTTFAFELSSLVQQSVDGYLRPPPQGVEASSLPGDYGTSAQNLSRDVTPAIKSGQYLLDELQRGFRVQYPPDSHDTEIDPTTQAMPSPAPLHYPDYAETGDYVHGDRPPSLSVYPRFHDAASPLAQYSQRIEDDASIRRKSCLEQTDQYAHAIASQGVEGDAAMRRKVCIDQITKYGHVIHSEGGSLPCAGPRGQVIKNEPVLDSVASGSSVFHSSDSHWPGVAVAVPAQPTEDSLAAPAYFQQEDPFPIPPVELAQGLTTWLSSPVNPEIATKPNHVPPATPSGVEHVVQVLIPQQKTHEVCEPTSPFILGLAKEDLVLPTPDIARSQQEIVPPVFCEPGRGSSGPYENSLNSEALHDVEIPDSQPEFLSPTVENNENALARQSSVQADKQEIANIGAFASEYEDELSVLALRPKRQLGPSATSPVVTRSKIVTPLTRRARKARDTKVTKTPINDCISSLLSDMLECSEDELSFR